MVTDTTLPHAVVNGIPVIDLKDVVVQEILDMDYATSAAHVYMYTNVYRTRDKYPKFKLGEQAFLSTEEAYEGAYRPDWYLVYEGVLPLTVRQAKLTGCYWGQNAAVARKVKELWDSIPLSQEEEE